MPEIKKPVITPEMKAQAQAQVKQKLAAVESFFETILVKRFVATFIDIVLITVPAVLITLPSFFLLPQKPLNLAALFNFIVFLAATVVVLIKDTPFQFAIFDGQTPGKKATNIRVVTLADKPITMQMSIKRNLIPASPLLVSALSALIYVVHIPFISEIASVFIILPLFLASLAANIYELFKIYRDEKHRRWGDEQAGTMVKFD